MAMKQLCTVLPTAALGVGAITVLAAGREARHRVVFEETVEGAEQWTGVLNNVENVQKSFGATETDIEVVAHGNGLGLVTNTNVSLKERMQRIASRGVVFAACENTMKRNKVSRDQLLSFVGTVDSEVAEVIRKQEAGWSFSASDLSRNESTAPESVTTPSRTKTSGRNESTRGSQW